MLYLYLLTYLLVHVCIAPVTKFFRREILADQQSVAELWKSESTNLNTIPILTEMRALLPTLGYFSYKKGLVENLGS
jgi:hypothetical protein